LNLVYLAPLFQIKDLYSFKQNIIITPFNTQSVMETRLGKLYYFEAAEFEKTQKFSA